MSAPRRFSQDDLAMYAMQLLSKEETAEVTAWLEQSEEGRRELAEVQGDLAIYAHTVDLHSPPALTRERLLKQVAKEKKAIPIDRGAAAKERGGQAAPVGQVGQVYGLGMGTDQSADVRPAGAAPESTGGAAGSAEADHSLVGVSRGTLFGSGGSLTEDDLPQRSAAAKVFPWVGWAVAAGLAVAAGNLYHERDGLRRSVARQTARLDHVTADAEAARQVLDTLTDPAAMRVTLAKGPATPAPQGRATYVAEKGRLIFVASNLEPLPLQKTYELWLIPAEGTRDPIPAGTFRPDEHGNASVILPALPKGVEAKAFGVTIEEKEGASTPTMPIILVGT
jgi:Anti-sigma-K factor rskA